jgi:Cu(I)/Ag(I) efflux system membrane protein CusA/SilA
MRRIAPPMVGGFLTSFVAELVVFPAVYFIWRNPRVERGALFLNDRVSR